MKYLYEDLSSESTHSFSGLTPSVITFKGMQRKTWIKSLLSGPSLFCVEITITVDVFVVVKSDLLFIDYKLVLHFIINLLFVVLMGQ